MAPLHVFVGSQKYIFKKNGYGETVREAETSTKKKEELVSTTCFLVAHFLWDLLEWLHCSCLYHHHLIFFLYNSLFFPRVCCVSPIFFYYFQAKREGKRKSLSVTASDFWKAPKKRENRTVGKVFLLSVQPVNTFQFAAETIQFRNPEAFSYYSLSLFFLWRADIYVQYITIELSLDGFVGPSKYDRST